MNNILTELTAQIVGLFFAYEINNNNTDALKAGNEVAKAFETILLHSKEATEIARKDREVSEQHGFSPTFSIEEMRKRAVLLADEWRQDNQHEFDSLDHNADIDYTHKYFGLL